MLLINKYNFYTILGKARTRSSCPLVFPVQYQVRASRSSVILAAHCSSTKPTKAGLGGSHFLSSSPPHCHFASARCGFLGFGGGGGLFNITNAGFPVALFSLVW